MGEVLERRDGLSQSLAGESPFMRATTIALIALTLLPATGAVAGPYQARGQDPNWTLAIGPETITLLSDRGRLRVDAPTPPKEMDGDETVYRAVTGPGPLTVSIRPGICRDTVDGAPFPDTVIVTFGERTFWGCGGDPARLLQGTAWRVTRIDHTTTPEDGPPTLEFRTDGRVAGSASCNAYTAGYEVTGDRLAITQTVSTRKACAPEAMEREAAFLSLLGGVARYEVGKDHTLVLITDDGRRVWARRP